MKFGPLNFNSLVSPSCRSNDRLIIRYFLFEKQTKTALWLARTVANITGTNVAHVGGCEELPSLSYIRL